ncbi:uncharacterized protein [Oscarella lobularis]|uniref:uncharacterized protein isoform X3 n=1 Tax=Oscarella lobularis TaxID=121494 RepID=UPI0033133D44
MFNVIRISGRQRQMSCLHLARDAEMAKYLIFAGAELEARDKGGRTPFLGTIEKGNKELMEVFIENSCDIHAKSQFGDALTDASCHGHLAIVKRLVQLGFHVNNNALQHACWKNEIEIAEYLLSVGADIEALNNWGRTPFLEAINWGNEKIMNFLIRKGCNIYARDVVRYTNKRGAIEIADSRNRSTLKAKLITIFREKEAGRSTDKRAKVNETKQEGEKRTLAENAPSTFKTGGNEIASFFEEESLDESELPFCGLQTLPENAEIERKSNAILTRDLHASQQLTGELHCQLDAAREERDAARSKVIAIEQEKNAIVSDKAQTEVDLERMTERCVQLEQERNEARLVAEEEKRNSRKYKDAWRISSTDIEIGDVKLGGGSYGDVRIGRWRGCNVAVKTFYDFLRVDVYLRRLEQEISICSQVHHPNVVCLLGAITQDDIPLRIVTELLEASLYDVIVAADGSLSLREQVDVAVGCSSGVFYLHSLDILHGDIRSTNVVLTSLMEAKICDLGAARFADASSLSAGPLSPEYVAPERLHVGQHNTKTADIYSLGVTFIELMTGEQPAATKRMAQGTSVRHFLMKRLCLGMVDLNYSKRPSARECLFRLETLQINDDDYKSCPAKRMVKGKMHGEERVDLVSEPWC